MSSSREKKDSPASHRDAANPLSANAGNNYVNMSTSTDDEGVLNDEPFALLSSDRSALKELLCSRLMECGWRDEVRNMCQETLREHGSNMNANDLMAKVIPKARSVVPETIKKELLMKIRSILTSQLEENDNNAPDQ